MLLFIMGILYALEVLPVILTASKATPTVNIISKIQRATKVRYSSMTL